MNHKKINIYIDESGDTGIKFDKGSSSLFVVSLLIINKDNLFKIEDQLHKIKNGLHIKQKELKFSQIKFNKKVSFYKDTKNIDFLAHVFVYKKRIQKDFSWFIINSIKYLDLKSIKDIKITIDGLDRNKISNDNIKIIRNIFKGHKIKISFEDSNKNILLQLSDMLAGLVHSIYRNKSDYKVLLKTVYNKIKITQIE